MSLIARRIAAEHALHLVSLKADDVGLKLAYVLSPRFPRFSAGGQRPGGWEELQEWRYEVEDDAGTEYRPAGGAYGAAEGVRTVVPSPLPGATTLTVTLRPLRGDVPIYRFQFPIPGPPPWQVELAEVIGSGEMEPA
jgi:hypothetical protein